MVEAEPVTDKLTFKVYLNRVLSGTATGIIVGLIPNAILGALFKSLGQSMPVFMTFFNVVNVMQFLVPALIGLLVGLQFDFKPMQLATLSAATFLGSGAYAVVEGKVALVGIGDLINVMLLCGFSAFVINWVGDKLGSLTVIFLPIIGAALGAVGVFTLPYISKITVAIGAVINSFTQLQPLIMSILICVSFSLLIISPISTVAIGIAIGIDGLGAGAAAVGVTACTAVLVWGSLKENKSGITIAILLGAMKMMIPNLVKYPKLAIPVVLNAIVSGVGVWLLNILGTPSSAGFGIVGLVGPISAITEGASFFTAVLAYLIIPFVGGYIIHTICQNVLHLYDQEIFAYLGS